MSELRQLLERGADGYEPSLDGWDRFQRRVRARQLRRRQMAAVVATVITLAASGLLVRAFAGRTLPGPAVTTPSAVSARLQANVTAQIDVGTFPGSIAVGEGAVWVSVPAQEAGESDLVVRIDPSTNAIVARIPVPPGVSDIAAGEGGVWVTTALRPAGERLELQTLRIDLLRTSRDQSSETSADGSPSVRATCGRCPGSDDKTSVLVKIDPRTETIISREPLGAVVGDVVVGDGFVWLTTVLGPSHETVIQVDAATNRVVRTLELPASYMSPVIAAGALWVPDCCPGNDTLLTPVDMSTGQVAGAPFDVGDGIPFGSAFGQILLMSERGTLYGLDTVSGRIEPLAKSDWPAAHGTVVFDPSSGSVWVANYRDTVTRIDVRPESSLEESI